MPERGDIIRIPRPFYNHYAIYIGDGQIVHRTDAEAGSQAWLGSVSSSSGSSCGKAIIKVEPLANYRNYVVDNYYDIRYKPLPIEQIVWRALSKVGETGYNIFIQNCEHFATWCRYGDAKVSREVICKMTPAGIGAAVGSLGGPAGAAAGAAIGFYFGLFIRPNTRT